MKNFARGALLALFLAVTQSAFADFPTKPIRIVIPYPAGGAGSLDAIVRLIGQEMSESLKQPVVLDYKPGGSTTIGAANVVSAPADGHVLFLNAQSFLITAQLLAKLPYDPKKDFTPVTSLLGNPHVLIVGPNSPYKTAKEFIEAARKRGQDMSYGSFGNASSGHLGFEGFKKTFGFQMVHVPYQGSAGINDVMAGRLDGMLADLPMTNPQSTSGKLVQLAVASTKRDPLAPDVPTIGEVTGVPYVSRTWFGLLVRSGTPAAIVATLQREIVAAMAKPVVAERIRASGYEALPSTPEEFSAFMDQESRRIAEVIKFANVRMQ